MSSSAMGGRHSKGDKIGIKRNLQESKVPNKHKKPLSPLIVHKDSKKQSPTGIDPCIKPATITNKVEKQHLISRHPELFESEEGSDVTFLVGLGPEIWRFPAHKWILDPASPVFSAMLKGPMSSKDLREEVPISDIEPKAFENVLRFVYTSGLKMTSIEVCLDTLYAAEKYMITELILLCLLHLDVNLSTNNVLVIYPDIRNYANVRNVTQEMGVDHADENPYIPLLNRCLERMDNYAEQVLLSEDFEALSDIEIISEIVFRDSLQVNSELTVFGALQRWATRQCKCRQAEMTPDNKRRFLGSALYAVRYLLMSKDEFMGGPYISDLLNEEEKTWMLAKICGHHDLGVSPHPIAERIHYLERRRGYSNLMDKGVAGQGRYDPSSQTLASLSNLDSSRKKKKCCKVSKVFTECFLCLSLFFD